MDGKVNFCWNNWPTSPLFLMTPKPPNKHRLQEIYKTTPAVFAVKLLMELFVARVIHTVRGGAIVVGQWAMLKKRDGIVLVKM